MSESIAVNATGSTNAPARRTASEPGIHLVYGTPITGPWPDWARRATFAMGCFWGAERLLWRVPGVISTFVGYAGGQTENPTYDEVCTGQTGHAEVAVAVYDPERVTYEALLKVFWENHDPTQWMRQGNDIGTQYRSAIFVHDETQEHAAVASRRIYQEALRIAGYGEIVTEIREGGPFYYAEPVHQQYLERFPNGYCNHGYCQARYPGEVAGATPGSGSQKAEGAAPTSPLNHS